jgi:hypothetical protein
LTKDVSADTLAYLPVQQRQFCINRLRDAETGGFDETTNLGSQFPECGRTGNRVMCSLIDQFASILHESGRGSPRR